MNGNKNRRIALLFVVGRLPVPRLLRCNMSRSIGFSRGGSSGFCCAATF